MKTAHEENIEAAENELLRLREELVRAELERKYPPSGCTVWQWRTFKDEQIARLYRAIQLRERAVSEWAQQLNLSFS